MSSSKTQQLETMAALIKSTFKPAEIAQLIEMIRPAYDGAELTSEEFAELINRLTNARTGRGRPLGEKSIAAARLILVQGASHAEASRELDMNLGQIGQLIKRLREHMVGAD
ncbi:hypothetical protein ABRY74_22890 [Pseudomonas guariconensis]|uniref:hypothetical protein n=1 Tax=Pseudomonas guariconensis TaxID=1288410 RepID=UPI003EE35DD2